LERERKRQRKEENGEVVRDTACGEGVVKNYISGFESCQAVSACSPGRVKAYDIS
jgi:hypothetical protein